MDLKELFDEASHWASSKIGNTVESLDERELTREAVLDRARQGWDAAQQRGDTEPMPKKLAEGLMGFIDDEDADQVRDMTPEQRVDAYFRRNSPAARA